MGIPPIAPRTGVAGDELLSLLVIGIIAAIQCTIWLLVRASDRSGSTFPSVDEDEDVTLRRWVEAHR